MTLSIALRTLALAALSLTLVSCGFALRGNDAVSASISELQFYSEQTNSELSRLLRRSLESAGISLTVANSIETQADTALLAIANEQLSSRPVSINPRARAAQIELVLSVDLALVRDEQNLIAAETLFVERTYFQDVENISGNQEEAEIISAEMRRELINQIMRRLAAVSPT
ncbi:MAG: hypothetical protein DHS20C12_14590 [Pseudohongiella sp.]|nr:MAG: hypothetical protein DHS20C12_14590 [Pseudohongiella sp.]